MLGLFTGSGEQHEDDCCGQGSEGAQAIVALMLHFAFIQPGVIEAPEEDKHQE